MLPLISTIQAANASSVVLFSMAVGSVTLMESRLPVLLALMDSIKTALSAVSVIVLALLVHRKQFALLVMLDLLYQLEPVLVVLLVPPAHLMWLNVPHVFKIYTALLGSVRLATLLSTLMDHSSANPVHLLASYATQLLLAQVAVQH